MKSILTKIHVLSLLCALPALADDVGLHNSSAQPTRAKNLERIVGVCQLAPNFDGVKINGDHHLSPLAIAGNYLWQFEFKAESKSQAKQIELQQLFDQMEKSAQIEILKQPSHGKLIIDDDYAFSPVPDYLGKDRVVASVKIGDYTIRINYYVQVINGPVGNGIEEKYCGNKGRFWKISTTLGTDSAIANS